MTRGVLAPVTHRLILRGKTCDSRATHLHKTAVAAARRTKLPPDANFWAYFRSNA